MNISILNKFADLLPTTTAKVSVLIAIGLLPTPWWLSDSVTPPMTQMLVNLPIQQLLAATTIATIGLFVALVSVSIFVTKTQKALNECQTKIEKSEDIIKKNENSELKYYSNDDSPNIKSGVVIPIEIFENGEFSAPGDILCEKHRMVLDHVRDKHFCSEDGCEVALNMTEREQVLTSAEKLASRDIYVNLNKIPVEVDTYSHGM